MADIRPINKILIANRGEIACRIIRACRELGIQTVAVYSEPDAKSLHVRMADEAYCVGPAPSRESYLNVERILETVKRSGADAVHPGYGFLSENAEFADTVNNTPGLVFIGPPGKAMVEMGEKTRARQVMDAAGVPVVPGTLKPVTSIEELKREAARVGFPLMLKAAAGGGGKGMRKVDRMEDLEAAYNGAVSEAKSSFNDDAVYIERFLSQPHHIEIQVFADKHGNVVSLFERECSVQRRHQKIIEESPSTIITPALRAKMGEIACRAAKAVGYVGAGTIEMLVDAERNFYFMEMNTRLQVEHPVTEAVTGLDLVHEQIRVAEGHPLSFSAETVGQRGHAIEARIYAEDPSNGFIPAPGKIHVLNLPQGPGIRNDIGLYRNSEVSRYYDPMVGKLIVWGHNREVAINRMIRALGEYVVQGITTNISYLRAVVDHPAFRAGDYDTGFIDKHMKGWTDKALTSEEVAPLIAAAILKFERDLKGAGGAAGASAANGGGGGANGTGDSPWRYGSRPGAMRR